jgi:hypothetical protein
LLKQYGGGFAAGRIPPVKVLAPRYVEREFTQIEFVIIRAIRVSSFDLPFLVVPGFYHNYEPDYTAPSPYPLNNMR